MKRMFTLLLAGSIAVGAVVFLEAQQGPAADLILTSGKIITVDDQFSIASALAVRGERILTIIGGRVVYDAAAEQSTSNR